MAGLIIAGLAALYFCVFFLKEQNHKIAALFSVDALVLAVMFFTGAPAETTAIFALAAAAVNVTAFFMPAAGAGTGFGAKDFAAMAVNIALAALAAVFIVKNPGQAAAPAFEPGPAVIVYVFMALLAAGYYIASGTEGSEK